MEFSHIDRKSPEIMATLANAPIYQKQGLVQARPAVLGEKIVTTLASGAQETTNEADQDDWVMTNPHGEQYIIGREKFFGRYEPDGEHGGGHYRAKGFCRAIKNPFGKPIEIMASWGSPQTGDENCMIADTCDADGNVGGEPYLIESAAFAETYKQV